MISYIWFEFAFTLGYFLRGQTKQEVIASFFVIVMARGQIVARGQVFMVGQQDYYNTIEFVKL